MLNIDTLNALPDLTADTLYAAEVARLPKLSKAEVEELIIHARQGDPKARNAFVVSCLSHALGKARFLYYERMPQHDDLLDLVQEANLRMVAALDRALATSAPAAYLRGIARRAILDYCIYHAGLIQKPEYSFAVLKQINPHPPTVESFDKPIYRDGKGIRVDLFQAPEPQVEPDERRQRAHYAVLYQALKTLQRKQRSVIIQLYGLYGQPMRTAGEIGSAAYIRDVAYKARKRIGEYLTKYLAEDLAQMLAPMPEEEA
jgi:RNA polymerase sigma factor (sigma-70 family)